MTTSTDTISDAKIAEAQFAADEAAAAYGKVEHLLYDHDIDNRQRAARAHDRMRATGEAVDRLTAQRRYAERARALALEREAAIETAKSSHAVAEKTHRKAVDELTARLVESRARVADASNKALSALSELLAVGQAHDDLVRQGAKRLIELGLPANDEKLELQWSVGGATNGPIRIRDSWWLPVSPSALFMRAAGGAARIRYGHQHDLSRRLASFPGVEMLDTRPDELMKDVPVPGKYFMPASHKLNGWGRAEVEMPAPALGQPGLDHGGYYDRNGKKVG